MGGLKLSFVSFFVFVSFFSANVLWCAPPLHPQNVYSLVFDNLFILPGCLRLFLF